jgi:hypothetical protein
MLNFLFSINKYFDKSVFTIVFLSLFILSAHILLYFEFIVPFVLIYTILVFLTLFRVGVLNINFDKSIYSIPKEGEIVVIKKDFYWNGKFLKRPEHGPGAKPWAYKIEKDTEWKVYRVKEYDTDWIIKMKNGEIKIEIEYLQSRKYWKSKSDIRNEILNKIGL